MKLLFVVVLFRIVQAIVVSFSRTDRRTEVERTTRVIHPAEYVMRWE